MQRIHERREKLRRSLKGRGHAAFLVTNPIHVSYLSQFKGEDASLVITDKDCILISDGRFVTEIEEECPDQDVFIKSIEASVNDAIATVIGKLEPRKWAFESDSMTVARFESLRDLLPTVEWTGEAGLVESLREVKDAEEIAAIRKAIDHAESAFNTLRGSLLPGQTEREIADRLESLMREAGASGASFPTIVAAGRRGALPHARPTHETRLGDQDFLLIDWGAGSARYKSDLTRLVTTGMVSTRFEQVYRVVLEAQRRGISAIRPGVTANEVDAEARSVIEEAGFGSFFNHGLGHGIGLEIHDSPRIRRGSSAVLQPGMVVTIEPGIYLPDWGGVRIEDDILVTPDGYEVLSRLPKSLDSLPLGSRG